MPEMGNALIGSDYYLVFDVFIGVGKAILSKFVQFKLRNYQLSYEHCFIIFVTKIQGL